MDATSPVSICVPAPRPRAYARVIQARCRRTSPRRIAANPRAMEVRSEEHTSELQSHRDLHSFPTRRSSDLLRAGAQAKGVRAGHPGAVPAHVPAPDRGEPEGDGGDHGGPEQKPESSEQIA